MISLTDILWPRAAILFDSYLPSSKVEERISRINQNNQRVKLLRSYYAKIACPVPTPLGSVSYSLLAPALRESLSGSRFAQATAMVPGEADEWCASCAYALPRSIIFSSDSDMLLYEYHAETRIMFFNDIELMTEPDFRGYSPAQITQTLDLTGLVPFAYCLTLDHHQLFNSLIKHAKSVDIKSKEYIDFSRRYERSDATEAYPLLDGIPAIFDEVSKIPQHLDVRVSELVDQLQNNIMDPVVYLPLLVEDPNAASAWNLGQDLRLLGYSLLEHSRLSSRNTADTLQGDSKILREYRRKAQIVNTQQLNLLDQRETFARAARLDAILNNYFERVQVVHIPSELTWQLLAFDLLLAEIPMPPKISLLIRVLSGDFDKTWDFVHLTARYHAVLYSLRMVKQCISFWLANPLSSSAGVREVVESLQQHVMGMPSIADLFLVPGQAKVVYGNEEMLQACLVELYHAHNKEVPSEKIPNKKTRKKQREAERKERRKLEEEGQQSFNVFDVLFKKV